MSTKCSVFGLSNSTIENHALLSVIDSMTGRSIRPFSESSREVVNRLSARLVRLRDTPQFVALGFWLRQASVERLKESFMSRLPNGHFPVPRGLAFHLPPANVDTIFVYSWALSLLAGNVNVVRLPSSRPPHLDFLIHTLVETLEEVGCNDGNIFCSYGKESSLTRDISLRSDLRVVWGGDSKVNEIAEYRIKPDGLSIGFPDRKSLAVINSARYETLDSGSRDLLAERLYNDIFWFDQMACGSPRVVAWVGDRTTCADLSSEFYGRLASMAIKKGYSVEVGLALSKFGFLNEALASGSSSKAAMIGNELSVFDLVESNVKPPETIVGGGLLGHVAFRALTDLGHLVNHKTQTISYFGFNRDELECLGATLVGKGGFRIVPVGQALVFDSTWDGVPFLEHMTRRITLTL